MIKSKLHETEKKSTLAMYKLSRTLVPKEELYSELTVGDKPPLVSCTLDCEADLPLYIKMECPDSFASPINVFVSGGPYKLYASFTAFEPSAEDHEIEVDSKPDFKIFAPNEAIAFKNSRTLE